MRTAIMNREDEGDDDDASMEPEMEHGADEKEEEEEEEDPTTNTASINRTVQASKSNDPNARVTPSPTLEDAAAAAAAAADEDADSEDEKADPEQPQGAGTAVPSAAEAAARRLAEEEARLLAEKEAQAATQLELDKIFDEQQEHKFDNVPAFRMPPGFRSNIALFPYQQDGVRWMLHQETATVVPPFYKAIQLGLSHNEWWNCSLTNKKTKEMPVSPASSILADDMGLGKTIQTLGLVLSNMPQEGASARCNLIVAPLSVIASWILQIQKFVQPGFLTVAEYKGDKRAALLPKVKSGKIDILLVSYETLVSDYKAHQEMLDEKEEEEAERAGKPQKKKAKRCQLADAWVSKKRSSSRNLDDSDDDSEDDFDPNEEDSEDDDDHYLPAAMTRKRPAKKQPSTWIFDIPFHRIILDEGHMIRNSSTGKFKAVMGIAAENKLALTGTPYVNKPEDLFSLFKFLGAAPLDDKALFTQKIKNPIAEFKEIGLSRVRSMMSHLALRRTKAVVNKVIQLPPKETVTRACEWSDGFHADIHEVLYKVARCAYASMLGAQDRKQVYGSMMKFLALVTRIRQSCCHGGLVPPEAVELAQEVLKELEESELTGADGALDLDSEEGKELLNKILSCLTQPDDEEHYDSNCAVCFNELEGDTACVLKTCKHVLCADCLQEITERGNSHCPMCRTKYRKSDIIKKSDAEAAAKKAAAKENKKKKAQQPKKEKERVEGADQMHPKEEAVLDEVSKMKPDEKGVIFSEWTSMLDIMESMLNANGYATTRIDGSMSTDERVEAMQAFESNAADSPRVILCSLMACGTGITLTRGNLCIIVEPWWNSATSEQACDRIYRIGQTRPVRVVHLIMKDSLEERMIKKVQDGKTALGKGSMAKLKKEDRNKARLTAMKDLFELNDSAAKWDGEFSDDDDEDDEDEGDGDDLDGFIVGDDCMD